MQSCVPMSLSIHPWCTQGTNLSCPAPQTLITVISDGPDHPYISPVGVTVASVNLRTSIEDATFIAASSFKPGIENVRAKPSPNNPIRAIALSKFEATHAASQKYSCHDFVAPFADAGLKIRAPVALTARMTPFIRRPSRRLETADCVALAGLPLSVFRGVIDTTLLSNDVEPATCTENVPCEVGNTFKVTRRPAVVPTKTRMLEYSSQYQNRFITRLLRGPYLLPLDT